MDVFLLIFAATLLVAVLFSALAGRTVLSAAVLFLVVGFVIGSETTGILDIDSSSTEVSTIAEIALFVVLFTDGMKMGWGDLRKAWRLPGRALGWGLPLTLGITAVLAHFMLGLDWPEALLIGAILAPTDPVFAAALVGNKQVPERLRQLLNVESGVNDGLALPFVVVFLAVSSGSEDLHLGELGIELLAGTAIGIAVPWIVIKALHTRLFAAAGVFEPIVPIAIGLLVFALASYTHANLFLAAFAAGVMVATVGQKEREAFEEFGEIISELLKLLALMVFGALLSFKFLGEIAWTGWLFAVLALIAARPIALYFSFLGSGLSMREQVAAMWFGPKGFASVVYVLVVVSADIPAGDLIFHIVALTIAMSIVAHSSTDVVVARSFVTPDETPAWQGPPPRW
ncbi:cation:proton antiporter [Salinibacterium sp. NSLL150]|uniref:cation:proton antiporter n=1 Tax=unclassified Salinibacterium TaxID=2632331 RepID=UPI0018CD24E4|nr:MULTISPECIES: cation:proton antiporter [unclassified Salinibacterium]MBH0099930.1 cation:proton antiporter [Salinibacterium sp. NSLL35]MBH0102684.1 cation:proton antiporter [Salinibacterium sp. NSLL150]MBH0105444.1 cation:proton antiporter [Salinibacterium sp. NSLL16]MBH0108204.1 cation:proton antiporter [Salinibacterium sp. NSLL17]MBH0110994.1 cation:proton antiporter [Salinibacterium sp. NG22]